MRHQTGAILATNQTSTTLFQATVLELEATVFLTKSVAVETHMSYYLVQPFDNLAK